MRGDGEDVRQGASVAGDRLIQPKGLGKRRFAGAQRAILRGGAIAFLLVGWFMFTRINQSWELVNPVLIPTPVELAESGHDLARQGVIL